MWSRTLSDRYTHYFASPLEQRNHAVSYQVGTETSGAPAVAVGTVTQLVVSATAFQRSSRLYARS